MCAVNLNKKEKVGHTFYDFPNGGFYMSRASKTKNGKVPKITEEEYAAYLSSLKSEGSQGSQKTAGQMLPTGAGTRRIENVEQNNT